MTRRQQFPPGNHPAPYQDLSPNEDEDLSPSDGYFGGNNSVPNTILIPEPSTSQANLNNSGSKATEAATESNSTYPSETRYASYTPATTYTPATSSRGSESAYNGSASRYHDSEDGPSERSPLLEEPPPLYDDAVSQRAPSNNMNETNSPTPPPRSGREPMQVREPVSSLRISGCGGRSAPTSMTVGVDNRAGKVYDEESEPVIPRQSKRRGCCRRRERQKGGRGRCRRFLSFLLGTILAIWLLVHLAKTAKRAHGPQTPSLPVNGTFPPDSDREIRQHETSHSISGIYPLYDLLDLKTISGSISITIVPHPGTAPAVLRIASTSGSITIKIDKSYLNAAKAAQYQDALKRTFDTKISSVSGSIGGSILISGGGETTITSLSGSLNLNLYPVHIGRRSPESRLSTTTTSGSSNIKVHDPVFGAKLTQLVAHHHSTGSGSTNIRYPSTWEGEIHAKSVGSGSVNVRGQGLQFEQRDSREVVAWRGEEKSRKMIDVSTLGSGSINFAC